MGREGNYGFFFPALRRRKNERLSEIKLFANRILRNPPLVIPRNPTFSLAVV